MEGSTLTIDNLKIGIEVSPNQLSNIYNVYMIIVYENNDSTKGKLVYIGDKQDAEYDKWFEQTKPITPIYNQKEDEETMYVYDE